MQSYGIDTTRDGWYDNYSWLKNHYLSSGTTNKATKPGKNSTLEENAAYQYSLYTDAMNDTTKAKTESAALKEFVSYWANRKDRNLSDEEIIQKIDWNKYPTLVKMKETAYNGEPMRLNEAVDMGTDDWLYGTIWAARNNRQHMEGHGEQLSGRGKRMERKPGHGCASCIRYEHLCSVYGRQHCG